MKNRDVIILVIVLFLINSSISCYKKQTIIDKNISIISNDSYSEKEKTEKLKELYYSSAELDVKQLTSLFTVFINNPNTMPCSLIPLVLYSARKTSCFDAFVKSLSKEHRDRLFDSFDSVDKIYERHTKPGGSPWLLPPNNSEMSKENKDSKD